jgi:uncharacterized membrane protein YkoI
MQSMQPGHRSTLALLGATILASAAPAAARAANDAVAHAPPPVRLAQAVDAAERHLDGRAVRAELEDDGAWEVEVVRGRSVRDVRVDARTGVVLSSTEDAADDD